MITVKDLRTVLDCFYDSELREIAEEMTDEELLEADVMEDFFMDSLDLVNLMMSVERTLGVSFTNGDELEMRRPKTVSDFLDMCNSIQRT